MSVLIVKRNRLSSGFTLPEVLVAATIMIIIAVGVLSVFSYVVRINRGENLRSQALSVMQKEIEHYRSLKFVPNSSGLTSAELNGRAETLIGTDTSADGQVFNLYVTIDNDPSALAPGVQTTGNDTTNLKEITIEARPATPQTDVWLQNLRTNVTFQRVRSN